MIQMRGLRIGASAVTVLTLVCGACLISDVRAGESRARGHWQTPDVLMEDGDIPAPQLILEVNFTYHADEVPSLRVKKMTIKRGYAPHVEAVDGGFVLSLHALDGSVLSSMSFQIPNRIFDPPPESGTFADGAPVILRAMEFSLTVPWIAEAVELRVTDPQGLVIITESLHGVPIKESHPNFHSFRHPGALHTPGPTPLLKKQDQGAWLLDWFMETAEAATTDGTALDIAFVGDKYTAADLLTFQQDVDRAIAHFMTYEPYASRANQILFHRVDNTTVDLGCVHDVTTTRLITCNNTTVTTVVNNAGAPYDKIIVLVKDTNYGGSGGPIAVSYNGDSEPQVVAHEFGHTFGGLLDEYNLYSSNGMIDGNTYTNCYAGAPPDTTWTGLVDPSAYTSGCKYPNWFRSSPCSIMLSLSCTYFNTVSQRQINAKLDLFAGSILPTVTLTATPPLIGLNGSSTLSWSTAKATTCQASGGWSGSQSLSGTLTVTPTSTTSYSLMCTNTSGSTTQNVTVSVDTQPPSVAISAPANGAILQGTVSVSATATDDLGVNRVDFYRDGLLIGSDNSTPYSILWGTTQETVGLHTLTARAIDVAGNATTSAPITVTLQANTDTQAPQVSILNPTDGGQISGRVKLRATASDNVGVVRLDLYVDGILKTSSTTSSVSITWNVSSSSVSPGSHTITASAIDAAGNVGKATITVVK